MEGLNIATEELLVDPSISWAHRHNSAVRNPACRADVGWLYIMNSVAAGTEKRVEFLSTGLRSIALHFVMECECPLADDRVIGPPYNFLRMVSGDDVSEEHIEPALQHGIRRLAYDPGRDGPLGVRFSAGTQYSLLWVVSIDAMITVLQGPSGQIDRAVIERWLTRQKYRGVN